MHLKLFYGIKNINFLNKWYMLFFFDQSFTDNHFYTLTDQGIYAFIFLSKHSHFVAVMHWTVKWAYLCRKIFASVIT